MGWLVGPHQYGQLPSHSRKQQDSQLTQLISGSARSPASSRGPELPERDGRGRRHVQGVHARRAWGSSRRGRRRRASLRSCPAPSVPSTRASRSGLRAASSSRSTASPVSSMAATVKPCSLEHREVPRPGLQPRPRNLEHRAHADPDAAAVERIPAARRDQDGVDVQGSGGAEDGTDVGVVHDVFQHRHPARVRQAVRGSGTGAGRCMAAMAPRCRWKPVISSSRAALPMKAGTSG